MKRLLAPVNFNGICLRLLQEEDLPETLAWRNQEDVRHWFKNSDVISLEDHFRWFSKYLQRDDDFTFIGAMGDTPMAQAAVYNVNFECLEAEVGRFIVAPSFQGLGYMKSTCEALLEVCSTQLGLNRVYLEVFSGNARGIGLYERLGFFKDVQNGDLIKMVKIFKIRENVENEK